MEILALQAKSLDCRGERMKSYRNINFARCIKYIPNKTWQTDEKVSAKDFAVADIDNDGDLTYGSNQPEG